MFVTTSSGQSLIRLHQNISLILSPVLTFQSLLTSLSLVNSPRLLARVERMMGVNQGERVKIIISREEILDNDIASIGKLENSLREGFKYISPVN